MDVGGISGARLRAIVEKIETLTEEKTAVASEIRDILVEAKATGFDPKIIREIVKLRKLRTEERAEQETLLDIYKTALGMLSPDEAPDNAAHF